MTTEAKHPVVIACLFTWTGFVCAISFMEAWLKFRAPGVTLPIGLGIGRVVFGALNKVEWVLAAGVLVSLLLNRSRGQAIIHPAIYGVILILIIQTVWLLPALDARAELYINNQPAPASYLHIYFVAAESAKLICLLIAGIAQFQNTSTQKNKKTSI